jgi:hypothetical protein
MEIVQNGATLVFTERQAGFLVHVMLHSGVCVGRQYCNPRAHRPRPEDGRLFQEVGEQALRHAARVRT